MRTTAGNTLLRHRNAPWSFVAACWGSDEFFAVVTLDSGASTLYPGGVMAYIELLLTGPGTKKTDQDCLAHPVSIVHDDAWPTAQIYKGKQNCIEAPMYFVDWLH